MKKILLSVMAGALTLGSITFSAPNFPNKNITVIVPKAPGGGTDITARGLAEYAKKNIDKNIVIVNKAGGGGVPGMVEGAKARKDGYTLTMTTVELAMLPHLGRSPVNYKDFTPIVAPIADPAALIVKADAPFNNLEDFIKYSKENPGTVKVGNSGIAAIWHLAAVAIEDKFNVKFNHIPYDGGSSPAVAALVGGHIDAITVAPGNAKPQIDAGELKVLAIMSEDRHPLFPNIPTFKESGMDLTVNAWAALAAPANMPKDIVDSLNDIFVKALKDPDFKKYLENQGISPVELTTSELKQIFENDHNYYGELLKKLNLNN